MATPASNTVTIRLFGERTIAPSAPRVLQAGERAAGGLPDPFVGPQIVQVEQTFDLVPPARATAPPVTARTGGNRLVALEAADGTTVFLRADKLADEVARLHPEAIAADGSIDLALLRDRQSAARGLLDFLWNKISFLNLVPDAIVDAAKAKAVDWLKDALGDAVGDSIAELAAPGASYWGAKALMWSIESQLAGEPGLYRWSGGELGAGDLLRSGDDRLTKAAVAGPLLLFIHGTGSHTRGGFGDLPSAGSNPEWTRLAETFGDRILGFEHRTFSESPIDNALHLARALPREARLALVTHSRGGLVGDLLCLGDVGEDLVRCYSREAPPDGENDDERRLRLDVVRREQETLRALRAELAAKNFRIERYVRVACPAHGTRLLSDNLDVFLSGLLSLTSTMVGMVTGPLGSPVLSAFKRIVLEIADKRIDPRLVPGIEAMHVGSPLGLLLARAPRKQGVQMAVIAGDVEGGSLLKRIGLVFTDWMLFDRYDNDLVVDTGSMYGGLAAKPGTRGLFDEGPEVDHFSYFRNPLTRRAMTRWLTSETTEELDEFDLVEELGEPTPAEVERAAQARSRSRGDAPGTRPVVVLLPGIMGSHLAVGAGGKQRRVWFSPLRLAAGGMGDIRFTAGNVSPDGLFEMFYGDLARHLEATHEVVRFPYDWRHPIVESAQRLADVVTAALARTTQPVRLLAHSMGGLVCRQMIAGNAKVWESMTARPGARFVMLGTPNNGSHLLVETLLGKADTVRKLARFDLEHDMQELLDIVAAFPGALQLLPRPGFADGGGLADYFDHAVWERLRAANRDRWFGHRLAGVPSASDLALGKEWWGDLSRAPLPDPHCTAYVCGQAVNTPCGITEEGGLLKMLGTAEGDGSVTWQSGRLQGLPDDRYWLMPTAHGDLADTEEHFPAIVELLTAGTTTLLARAPVTRAAAAAVYPYDAAPTPCPTETELAQSLMGARPKRRARGKRSQLTVSVSALDLRFAQQPVMCGHYVGDAISGAEALIDRELVAGELSRRDSLGIYPAELGSNAIVLNRRSEEAIRRGTGRGAVIVGLGEYGKLSARQLGDTVRAGVVRLLLFWKDHYSGSESSAHDLHLMSLLLGHNSTTHISVQASVDAVVQGVCEANRQFQDAMGSGQPCARVAHLEFIELYLDTAITAAHELAALPKRLEKELGRLRVSIDASPELNVGKGARPRLFEARQNGYWARLIVTDADRTDETATAAVVTLPSKLREPNTAPFATRLKYVFLSERARAEATELQRQPGLVEGLVQAAITNRATDATTANTLFHHLLPIDFRGLVRQAAHLVMVVDSYTANLPWEMVSVDGQPLAVTIGLVRQLVSAQGRSTVRNALAHKACIIANPSTEGFWSAFPDGKAHEETRLVSLAGAEKEGEAIRDVLQRTYQVTYVPPDSEALDVHNKLLADAYRILMIAGHGVVDALHQDGTRRTGVVLSSGLLLTAAEICLMEVVPQVVFLNCCHLGKVDHPSNSNRLAHGLARELIQIGVRCVVAAGWPVDDNAAATFATTFFEELVTRGQPFGDAVLKARRACYEEAPQLNTWGAYQAYGDPTFVLDPAVSGDGAGPRAFTAVCPDELLERFRQTTISLSGSMKPALAKVKADVERVLGRVPAAWIDLPAVQYELAEIYASFGQEGFELATRAYLRAIAEEDRLARVPIRAIEQLANLEAKTGVEIGGAEGLARIDRAIERLRALLTIGAGEAPAPSKENSERLSILASALKRKAYLQAGRLPWTDIEAILIAARTEYEKASAPRLDGTIEPYPMLNRLQLHGFLGVADAERTELIAAAERAAAVARARFPRSGDYFDAVMPADAELAKRLIDGSVGSAGDDLVKSYRAAIDQVHRADLVVASTIQQLQMLAAFHSTRKQANDSAAAATLERVAREIANVAGTPLGAGVVTPADEKAAPEGNRTTAGAKRGRGPRKRGPKRTA